MGFKEAILVSGHPWTASLVYFIPALVVLGLYLLYRQLLPKPIPGIAYNAASAASIFGDGADMARTVGETGEFGPWCAAQIEKSGEAICQVFVQPLGKPWVLLADFHEAYDILSRRTAPSRDADFDKSRFITENMNCLGDFHAAFRATTRGDHFRNNRALIQDLMTPTFLNGSMGPMVHEKGMQFVRLMEAKMRLAGGRPFDIRADIDRVALDVVLYFAFMEEFDESSLGPQVDLMSRLTPSDVPGGNIDAPVTFPEAPEGPLLNALRVAPSVVEHLMNSLFPRLNLWWWRKHSWYQKTFSDKYRVIRGQFKKALKNYHGGEVRSAAEHMLMREEREAERQGRAAELGSDILVDELFGVLVAGHHTTGGALGWLVKCLTSYPDLQAHIRKTMFAALPEALAEGRPPTFEELRRARLPYLDAFIEETLRLNAVPITRETTRDTTILSRHVPKGSMVILISDGPGFLSPSFAVSPEERSPAARASKMNGYWDETQDLRNFNLERWLVRTGEKDDDVEFNGAAGPQLVFGQGVRGCWGKRLAQIEMRTTMALLMWHFELLEIPEALTGNEATEGVARKPRKAFVRLRKVVHT
ncbi:cytochrome P450 [Nemania abortiva]|nr:cytochrome P450 [Nemania abortiva]